MLHMQPHQGCRLGTPHPVILPGQGKTVPGQGQTSPMAGPLSPSGMQLLLVLQPNLFPNLLIRLEGG